MILCYDDGLPIYGNLDISFWGCLNCCILGTFRGYSVDDMAKLVHFDELGRPFGVDLVLMDGLCWLCC